MKKKIVASQGQSLIAMLTKQYRIFSVKNFKNKLRKSTKSCFNIEFQL
jgi:hypothetical protein